MTACSAASTGDEARADSGQAVDAGQHDSPDWRQTDGGFAYVVTVKDPAGLLSAAHDAMAACAEGGLAEWAKYLSGKGVLTVELRVQETATGRFAGASTSNVSVGPCKNTANCTLVQEQAIHRLTTGLDNPAMKGIPDVHIDIDANYWNQQVWVDPDPRGRTAGVPNNRIDCVSLFTHELGHALGMTGFRSLTTFQPTIAFQSLYDDLIVAGASILTFEGPLTKADFGSVALTRTNTTQNVYHYGDATMPSGINTQLMNGISYMYGHRYRVQKLDVRILQDLGLTASVVPSN